MSTLFSENIRNPQKKFFSRAVSLFAGSFTATKLSTTDSARLERTMKTSAPAFFLKHQLLKIFTFTLLVAAPAFSQSQFKVLHNFTGTDGSWPQSVIFDHAGNLYGTTAFGGNTARDCNRMGCGTVFELVRNPDGTWTETVLYAFCSVGSNCTDGYNPSIALVFDAAGNLYGTTLSGGANGWGEVYELTPNGQGQPWTVNVLYSFCPLPFCSDGSDPSGALAIVRDC